MKTFLFLFLLMSLPSVMYAQDRMIKTDNTISTVKIFEISEELIRYKPFTNQDGPMFTIRLINVHKVILESGDELEYSPLLQDEPPATETTPMETTNPTIGGLTTAVEDIPAEDQDMAQDNYAENAYNTTISISSLAGFDFGLSENLGEEVYSFFMEAGSFNLLFPMGGSDMDEKYNESHGIVAQIPLKMGIFESPDVSSTLFRLEMGAGYGYNYSDFRFYGTLNTTLYFNSTTTSTAIETVEISEWLPSDSGSLRLGVIWTGINGKRNKWGFHAALDSYFAEGSDTGFIIGFSFRN